jgi:hypothetical protein
MICHYLLAVICSAISVLVHLSYFRNTAIPGLMSIAIDSISAILIFTLCIQISILESEDAIDALAPLLANLILIAIFRVISVSKNMHCLSSATHIDS